MESSRTQSDNRIELRISAVPQYLGEARLAVGRAAVSAGMNEQDADMVTLAVHEALTNIISHGYSGPCDKQIIIELQRIDPSPESSAALEVIIRDFGKKVEPQCIQGRDLDDLRPGGLGVHIIRSIMDEIEYTSPPQGGMQLRMLKYV